MVTPFVPPIYNNNSRTLLGIIHNLGLTTSLNFVLDAADLRSYDGSSQTWTDATGNGNDFFRGADGAATATDPTFNGTAGLATEATYFSLDGGDYFTETAAHTFADDWHKNNGQFSLVVVYYAIAGATAPGIFSNGPSASADADGIDLFQETDETAKLRHAIDDANSEQVVLGTLSTTSWNYVGCSFNEATPACAGQVNGTASAPAVVGSTSTSANTQPLRIGAFGSAGNIQYNLVRFACLAGWSTAIGATALSNLYKLLKARRFTSLP